MCLSRTLRVIVLSILVIAVVHRHHSQILLLVASLVWEFAWCLLVPLNLLRRRPSSQLQISGLQALFLKPMVFLLIETYRLPLRMRPRAIAIILMFGSLQQS